MLFNGLVSLYILNVGYFKSLIYCKWYTVAVGGALEVELHCSPRFQTQGAAGASWTERCKAWGAWHFAVEHIGANLVHLPLCTHSVLSSPCLSSLPPVSASNTLCFKDRRAAIHFPIAPLTMVADIYIYNTNISNKNILLHCVDQLWSRTIWRSCFERLTLSFWTDKLEVNSIEPNRIYSYAAYIRLEIISCKTQNQYYYYEGNNNKKIKCEIYCLFW